MTPAAKNRSVFDMRVPDRDLCAQTAQEVAALKAVVEALAAAMERHADAVRALVDAVQALTATRDKP
jgi:cobyrinic acid a,c-diamide synthase